MTNIPKDSHHEEIVKYNFFKAEYQKLSKQFTRDEDPLIKAKLDIIKRKIGEMLSDDCPLCGKRVINLIDQPFYTEEEYSTELEKWKI
uniref:Uncharacterized protein n=1 Tax=Panagrolaimus davidi TaxID=227884 RepID=A0A914QRZ6_9BILA